ncbi:uncharacterized protein LOC130803605 [Amaranthus tricolor]|uniref:uncharacterized protein LOC130803605 n=1 Tax=Amaranthus tricolor TaxID=29722 RepID=UPI00258C0392|nr:uncharacterized protein LOC130803605 [Amaranthus tricolor]XP_057523781.1 uncharacterized protein LOC130803605 [Amaranthus tricolor]
MISHLSDCIEKGSFVGYGGLMRRIFKKFDVPVDGLQFPMGRNTKIGAKCLHNLYLKLNDEGILVHEMEEVVDIDLEEEKDEELKEKLVKEEKEQQSVPTATTKTAETREQGEVASKGESEEKEEALEDEDHHILGSDSNDEEIVIAMRKKADLIQRKSRRLASKRKAVMVDDITSHAIPKPSTNAPLSPKPATSPSHQIPSPPPSPIQFTPPPFQSQNSPGTGCANFGSVPAASLDSILSKL